MGKKSRLKKEREVEKKMTSPLSVAARPFLEKRRVTVDQASRLLHLVSVMVNFLLYRSIREHIQLPSVRPDEQEADKDRMEAIRKHLGSECRRLGMAFQDVMQELVMPLAENETLFEPILKKVYAILDSLVSSEDFRAAIEKQIEDGELWHDSLAHYENRREDYFDAVKRLFALDLAMVRSSLDGAIENISYEETLEDIKQRYGIEADDFQKLRRRATEFLRATFATYLDMDFQPVRKKVDEGLLARASGTIKPAG